MGKDNNGKELGKGITQRANGVYQARFTDRFGIRKCLYNSSLQQLRAELKEAMREDISQQNVRKDYTLNEWYEVWMKEYKCDCRDSTRLVYQTDFKKHISPVMGSKSLKEITALDVRHFLNEMKASGYGYEVRSKCKIILVCLFDRAIENDLAIKNPARGIKVERSDEEDEDNDPHFLTVEDEKDFFAAAKGTFYEDMFVVHVLTGLRPGELFALDMWNDIDWKKKTISVTKTLLYQKLDDDTKKNFHTHPPKTKSSRRKVHFDDRCAFHLKRAIKRKQIIASKRNYSPLEGYENLLFTTKYGTPINSQIYCDAIARIVEFVNESRPEYDQLEKFSGHTFRHTYATRCFEAGVSPKTVQAQLGHASLKMTLDLYTHLTDDYKRDDLEKVSALSDLILDSNGTSYTPKVIEMA